MTKCRIAIYLIWMLYSFGVVVEYSIITSERYTIYGWTKFILDPFDHIFHWSYHHSLARVKIVNMSLSATFSGKTLLTYRSNSFVFYEHSFYIVYCKTI